MKTAIIILALAGAAQAGALEASVNARIRAALQQYTLTPGIVAVPATRVATAPVHHAPRTYMPAPTPVTTTVIARRPGFGARIRAAAHALAGDPPCTLPHLLDATVWEDLTATTDRGGHVSTPGPRGNWRTTPNDAYVALPDYRYGGSTVFVRSRKTGRIVELPVYDTGPWSTCDGFIIERRRPWAESGHTNIRKYRGMVPDRAPSVDLTPAAWRSLGEDPGSNAYASANYAGRVDLIVPNHVIARMGVN